jgi:hypothetical protein
VTGRRRQRVAAALVALVLVAGPGGREALAVGNGPGSSPGCTSGVRTDVQAASTPGQPVRVTTGSTVTCPTPERQDGGQFGPTAPLPGPPPVPGTDCVKQVNEPMELSLTPGGQYQVFWPDPTFNGNGSSTPEPQDVGRVISGIGAKEFFMRGGSTDFYLPFTLKGKWNANATDCVPKDPKDPQASYTWNCPGATIAFACLLQRANGPVDTGGLPLTALTGGLTNLRGLMLQLIHPGNILTLPAEPHPGVVNIPTCFFLNGADIDGQDVRQPATFEMVLVGPADGNGRQIFYVFRVDLMLQSVDWQFGDGSGQVEGLPGPCLGVSNAPLQFAHRYRTYSPPGGFPVVATETFSIHVTEYWSDANGPEPPHDLGDLPPIAVNPGPPGFVKHVIQEEGVPVGN